ncbi:hypothetical protein CF66_2342 [Candidatus Photodesmus katoptron]|uniref:YceI-like protein n=1 Tax=Candidatus Photodesmus katoptron Akat1 TaxID=1236703 RepID=S3E0B4_9GAMM|nr:YceI family protein [Candidatus Photodesmus katoptron]EPE37636.1 YceI-like protein [Candidatus Photodesmus katoptron Akat1]KEY90644.1 hypothetical protein CF66_2342 [Candidatus Photodesmus katoptron]
MKKIYTYITVIMFLFLSKPTFSKYQLDNSISTISYASIKKQYIVEPATITTLTGSINEEGVFQVNISPLGIDSLNPIRDKRLNELFFQSNKYPNIEVSGKVNLSEIDFMPIKMTIPANITLLGNTKKMQIPLLIIKSKDYLSVSSTNHIIINSDDFSIPIDNLNKLAETVGGIPISNTVPVIVNLIFKAL